MLKITNYYYINNVVEPQPDWKAWRALGLIAHALLTPLSTEALCGIGNPPLTFQTFQSGWNPLALKRANCFNLCFLWTLGQVEWRKLLRGRNGIKGTPASPPGLP